MSFGGPNRLGGFVGPGGHDLWNPASLDNRRPPARFVPQTSVPIAPNTPRTAAIKAEIASIPDISLGQGKRADYRTIFAQNARRVEAGEESWNNRSMEKAVGIEKGAASAVRDSLRPDTPRTAAIKAEIASIPDISLGQGKSADYRTILVQNAQRVEAGEESWNNRSMEKAANICQQNASRIRSDKK